MAIAERTAADAPGRAPVPARAHARLRGGGVSLRRGAGSLRAAAGSPAAALALGLGAVIANAAFASGAIALPMEARLQAGIAVLAVATLATLLFSPALRISAGRLGWGGLALLVTFTAFTGLSLAWSIAPDG